MKTFFQGGSPEIHKEPNGQFHQTQVGQQLFAMNRGKRLYQFELNDHTSFNEKVDTESLLKQQPIIFKADRLLALHPKSALLQRPRQHHFIDRFKKARPQFLVHVYSRINRSPRYFIKLYHFSLSPTTPQTSIITRGAAEVAEVLNLNLRGLRASA